MMKCLSPVLLLACGLTAAFAQSPALKLRQVIIRAPDTAVAAAALEHRDDAALAETLWRWVKEGTARVVSDVTREKVSLDQLTELSVGEAVEWPSERDQDFDNLILKPVAFQKTFVGTEVKATSQGTLLDDRHWHLKTSWETTFSPRGPMQTTWPLVWPANKEPRVAWLEQPDFFGEGIKTTFQQAGPGTTVLAILRPADVLEPQSPNQHCTDVILAVVEPAVPSKAPADPASRNKGPGSSRLLLLGVGVGEAEALELIFRRRPGGDPALLAQLLASIPAGKATLRTCCAATQCSGWRSQLESGRRHSYPTEMPTFPSAWETRLVGTILEASYDSPGQFTMSFFQHTSLPRRAMWPCAVDSPGMVMWQPQFISPFLQTNLHLRNGEVTLVGVLRAPDCLVGADGIVPSETLLLFARLDEVAPDQTPPAPPVLEIGADGLPVPQVIILDGRLELETVVFDLPSGEEPAWKEFQEGAEASERFAALVTRAKEGRAKIAAHFLQTAVEGHSTFIGDTEEVVHVVAGEPDYRAVAGRLRPTACERTSMGASWELEFTRREAADGKTVQLTSELKLDTQRPRHATLEEMIAYSKAHGDHELPPLAVFQESWHSELALAPGKTHYLGLKHPPGEAGQDRVHVAFVRTRLAN